jgi:hypothetical protein
MSELAFALFVTVDGDQPPTSSSPSPECVM